MRHQPATLSLLLFIITIVISAFLVYPETSIISQTLKQDLNATIGRPSRGVTQLSPKPTPTPTADSASDVVKVDVDLVKVDALVMQKNTARIVGGLKKEDFLIYEDGTKQEITHFSTDSLPLSVILVIDRGSQCPFESVDPYVDEVRRAARETIEHFKPVDEIAVMSFDNRTTLEQPFTRNRIMPILISGSSSTPLTFFNLVTVNSSTLNKSHRLRSAQNLISSQVFSATNRRRAKWWFNL